MEHAATEILLNIFRYIDDGLTLLDCVSLVCARWNSVAKDPRAWAGVRVTIRTSKDRFYVVPVNEARVAVHAPALKELKLQVFASSYYGRAELTSNVRLEKVLTRCRAAIQKVACDDWYNMKPDSRTALYSLLKRNENTLRALSSGVRGHVKLHEEMLSCMSTLKHLQELKLFTTSRPQYSHELKGRLPSLRVLVYSLPSAVERVPANHRSLLQDLLEGAADSLRRIDIGLPLHSSTVQSLSKCVKVTSLSIHVAAVSAIQKMTSLCELTVVLHSLVDCLPLKLELVATDSLPALHQLKVVTANSFGSTDVAGCGAALLAIGRAAPNMKRLIIENYSNSPAALEKHVVELLSILPDLQSVSLSYGWPSIVPRLLALERLEYVRVCDLRVPGYDMKECCDTLREIKRLRPNIVGSVNVTPIRVEPVKFVWHKPWNI